MLAAARVLAVLAVLAVIGCVIALGYFAWGWGCALGAFCTNEGASQAATYFMLYVMLWLVPLAAAAAATGGIGLLLARGRGAGRWTTRALLSGLAVGGASLLVFVLAAVGA